MKFETALTDEYFKLIHGYTLPQRDYLKQRQSVTHISLTSGRRSTAAFQIVILPGEEGTLSIGPEPVFSPAGECGGIRLRASGGLPVRLSLEGLMPDDLGLQRAEVLLSNQSILLEKRKPQAVWAEIEVPEDTRPGEYEAVIDVFTHHMFEAERRVKSLTVGLTVKDVILPGPEDTRFYLDLWQHNSNIARKHEAELWSDAHFGYMEKYVEALAELGARAVTVIASEIPWSGQNGYRDTTNPADFFEYNMVRVFRQKDGFFRYDYSVMQRYIDLCDKYGIRDEIELLGLINIWQGEEGYGAPSDYPDGIRIRYLDESDGTYRYMTGQEEIQHYIRSLEHYFISTGQIERVRVAADEPGDLQAFRTSLRVLKETAPSFVYKSAFIEAEFLEEFQEDIADIVPSYDCATARHAWLKDRKDGRNGRILWYVCGNPSYPNTFIKSPMCEAVALCYLTKYMGLQGLLRWSFTAWTQHPREDVGYRSCEWPSGDVCLVYPSAGGGPLLSLRYKMLKRGIEQFELMCMTEAAGGADVLEQVWDCILRERDVTKFESGCRKKPEELYSTEPADYEKAKNLLLDYLQRRNGGAI